MINLQLVLSSVDVATAIRPAFAYLDPGTGSYALQILLATLFGGMFALKQSWSAVRARLVAIAADFRSRASTENARPGIHGQPTAEVR